MAKSKPRVSRHNGRAGNHGVYNPKHNDRQFDVAHAENSDRGRTSLNLYWDWQNGLWDHWANQSGQYPTFNQVERGFYEQRYSGYLAGQTARNVKAGHAGRNRTVDDLLSDARICPEETICPKKNAASSFLGMTMAHLLLNSLLLPMRLK